MNKLETVVKICGDGVGRIVQMMLGPSTGYIVVIVRDPKNYGNTIGTALSSNLSIETIPKVLKWIGGDYQTHLENKPPTDTKQ